MEQPKKSKKGGRVRSFWSNASLDRRIRIEVAALQFNSDFKVTPSYVIQTRLLKSFGLSEKNRL